jgi:hypothetical protein
MNTEPCIRPGQNPTTHRFDAVSGWCLNGCGARDDGRIVSRSGAEILRARPSEAHLFEYEGNQDDRL